MVESFENQVKMPRRSSTHSHRSSTQDEILIQRDLRVLRPFRKDGRNYKAFGTISHDPIQTLDKQKFREWIARHKRNILLDFPFDNDE